MHHWHDEAYSVCIIWLYNFSFISILYNKNFSELTSRVFFIRDGLEKKGSTSISDFLAASDIGKRKIEKNGKKCLEYYSYKDGLTVKTESE